MSDYSILAHLILSKVVRFTAISVNDVTKKENYVIVSLKIMLSFVA